LFAKACELFSADRCRNAGVSEDRSLPPHPYDKDDQRYSGQQREVRHEPCNTIEAAIRRCSEHERAVRLNEKLRDCTIRVAAVNRRSQFLLHARKVRTSQMIALEQNLIAAAHADDLMTDAVHTSGVASSQE